MISTKHKITGENYDIYSPQEIFPPNTTEIIILIIDVDDIQDNIFCNLIVQFLFQYNNRNKYFPPLLLCIKSNISFSNKINRKGLNSKVIRKNHRLSCREDI